MLAFAEWESAVALRVTPEDVAWRDGVLRVAFAAEYTHRGEPMTFPAAPGSSVPWPPRDLDGALRWPAADTVGRFGRAGADLLLRHRNSAAQYFQPVDVVRETVPTGDGTRVRLVVRATATVDPATAVDGGPVPDGLWDAYVRFGLGGWTKDARVGPAPRHGRTEPHAGVVAGRVVLHYWTDRHTSLALDVGRAGRRLGLGRVAPRDVVVEGDRILVPLPLYVPGPTGALLRLAPGRDVTAELAPAPDGGALLTAAVPATGLPGRAGRVALCPAPGAPAPRFLPLSFALRAGGDRPRCRLPGRVAHGGWYGGWYGGCGGWCAGWSGRPCWGGGDTGAGPGRARQLPRVGPRRGPRSVIRPATSALQVGWPRWSATTPTVSRRRSGPSMVRTKLLPWAPQSQAVRTTAHASGSAVSTARSPACLVRP